MRTKVGWFSLIVFTVTCWTWGSWGYGQVATGTISGTVRDTSGAVVPGAAVRVLNTDTGISRSLVSDNRGYYIASNLGLGKYEVSVSLSGFRTEVRRGIVLSGGQH